MYEKATEDAFIKHKENWSELNNAVQEFNSSFTDSFKSTNSQLFENIKEYGGEDLYNQLIKYQEQINEFNQRILSVSKQHPTTFPNSILVQIQEQLEESYKKFAEQQDLLKSEAESTLLQLKEAQKKYFEQLYSGK
jgi:cell division septal protein FtsQ